jgi:prevent-host-death family protein
VVNTTNVIALGDQIWPDLVMRRIKIADLKANLSSVLHDVEAGEALEVVHRDRPVARLMPLEERASGKRMGRVRNGARAMRARRYPPARWSVSSLDLLREERGNR